MHSCDFALKRVLHYTHIPETKKTRHFSKDWPKNMCKKIKKQKYNNQYPTNFASNTLNSEFRASILPEVLINGTYLQAMDFEICIKQLLFNFQIESLLYSP